MYSDLKNHNFNSKQCFKKSRLGFLVTKIVEVYTFPNQNFSILTVYKPPYQLPSWFSRLSTYTAVSVCLCPINGKAAEPIGPKFFVGPHVTQGKVYRIDRIKDGRKKHS